MLTTWSAGVFDAPRQASSIVGGSFRCNTMRTMNRRASWQVVLSVLAPPQQKRCGTKNSPIIVGFSPLPRGFTHHRLAQRSWRRLLSVTTVGSKPRYAPRRPCSHRNRNFFSFLSDQTKHGTTFSYLCVVYQSNSWIKQASG